MGDDDDIYAGLSRTEIAELKRKEEELLMQADLKEKNKARIEEIRIERQKREEEEWRRQQEEEERVAKIRAEQRAARKIEIEKRKEEEARIAEEQFRREEEEAAEQREKLKRAF